MWLCDDAGAQGDRLQQIVNAASLLSEHAPHLHPAFVIRDCSLAFVQRLPARTDGFPLPQAPRLNSHSESECEIKEGQGQLACVRRNSQSNRRQCTV